MKQIVIKDLVLTPVVNENHLISFSDAQVQIIRDAILRHAFIQFSMDSFHLLKTEHTTILMSGVHSMSAEFYSALMQYFFHEQAFTSAEKEKYSILDVEMSERQMYIAADELLTFKPTEFIVILKEIIKDDLIDFELIASIRFAFLKMISKI